MVNKIIGEILFDKKPVLAGESLVEWIRNTPSLLLDAGDRVSVGNDAQIPEEEQIVLVKILREISALSWKIAATAELYGRVKSLQSTLMKMNIHGFGKERVLDAVGVRVIFARTEECYRLVEQIHRNYNYIQSEYNDYIRAPKLSGYRSLHTTILVSNGRPIEIQIRTQWMHALAEKGRAAHWLYKQRKE